MPTEYEVVPAANGKLTLVRREDGEVNFRQRVDPDSAVQQRNLARRLNLPVTTLLRWFDAPGKHTPTAEGPMPSDYVVRRMDQTRSEGEKHRGLSPEQVLNDLLPSIPRDQILDWSGRDGLCCLDVDYHGSAKPPARHHLTALVTTALVPRPYAWHFSRSGGLHLFYIAAGEFTAEELASVAALRWKSLDAVGQVELKSQVRGPGDEPIDYTPDRVQDTNGTLLEWLRGPAPTAEGVDDWLAEHGMVKGGRYTHDKCPIHPTDDPGDKRDPVTVFDGGVYCHLCGGKGRSLGHAKPGLAAWPVLLGAATAGELGFMIRGLAHWGHARWVLAEKFGITGPLAELGYRTALKAYHTGRPSQTLVPLAFNDKLDKYARVMGGWMNLEERKEVTQRLDPILAAMPAAKLIDDKGAVKSDPLAVAHLFQEFDLTDQGYPSLHLVAGVKLAAPHQYQYHVTRVAVPNNDLRRGGNGVLPRYVPFEDRMDIKQAWEVMGRMFPLIDRTLIELIICAAATAQETELGEPPRIMVTGPSSSAKSSHFKVAAGIMGFEAEEPVIQSDEQRLRQAFADSILKSPLVVVNEVFKDSQRNRNHSPKEALEFLLNMTRKSRTHRLYKGSQEFGMSFVIGLTDITLPAELGSEKQQARRIHYHQLHHEVDWQTPATAVGMRDFHLVRLVSQEVADACNAILSDVSDRFFAEPMSFAEQAERLGVKRLEQHEQFIDPRPYLRYLFRLVCEAPPPENPRVVKMYPYGYKEVVRNPEGNDRAEELFVYYTKFADGFTGDKWLRARQLVEKDWGSILGVPDPVKLQLTDNGSSVFLRFQVGSERKPKKVNEQIIDPSTWEAPKDHEPQPH